MALLFLEPVPRAARVLLFVPLASRRGIYHLPAGQEEEAWCENVREAERLKRDLRPREQIETARGKEARGREARGREARGETERERLGRRDWERETGSARRRTRKQGIERENVDV